jgi:SAM-dependent methyltransferase
VTPNERVCPACGRTDGRTRSVAVGKVTMGGGRLEILHCECGAAFQPRVPTDEELARWYDYMGQNPVNFQTTPLIRRRLSRIVDGFEAVRHNGRLLEVGCGGGLFVRAATARGWEVWGTEISPSCLAELRPLLGNRLYEGSVETVPFPEASFDGATMVEVVEHLGDPLRYLEAIHRLLRPGGRLFLTTPNARGVSGRVLGTDWRAFADEHLSYFDIRSIRRLLERAGFDDVQVLTTNFDLMSLTEDLRRRLPNLPRKSAVRPVERGPASDAASSSRATSSRVELMAGALDIAIEAANRVARVSRMGDTLKVAARRP